MSEERKRRFEGFAEYVGEEISKEAGEVISGKEGLTSEGIREFRGNLAVRTVGAFTQGAGARAELAELKHLERRFNHEERVRYGGRAKVLRREPRIQSAHISNWGERYILNEYSKGKVFSAGIRRGHIHGDYHSGYAKRGNFQQEGSGIYGQKAGRRIRQNGRLRGERVEVLGRRLGLSGEESRDPERVRAALKERKRELRIEAGRGGALRFAGVWAGEMMRADREFAAEWSKVSRGLSMYHRGREFERRLYFAVTGKVRRPAVIRGAEFVGRRVVRPAAQLTGRAISRIPVVKRMALHNLERRLNKRGDSSGVSSYYSRGAGKGGVDYFYGRVGERDYSFLGRWDTAGKNFSDGATRRSDSFLQGTDGREETGRRGEGSRGGREFSGRYGESQGRGSDYIERRGESFRRGGSGGRRRIVEGARGVYDGVMEAGYVVRTPFRIVGKFSYWLGGIRKRAFVWLGGAVMSLAGVGFLILMGVVFFQFIVSFVAYAAEGVAGIFEEGISGYEVLMEEQDEEKAEERQGEE